MSAVHLLQRPASTLRTIDDHDRSTYWCNMHADLAHEPGRACFKPTLVDEILRYQQVLSDRLRVQQQRSSDAVLAREWRRTVGSLGTLLEATAAQVRREVARIGTDPTTHGDTSRPPDHESG